MPCYHPTPAYQAEPGGRVILNPPVLVQNMQLPCGTCLGCRKRRAREWAHRAVHEASQHQYNSFVTLTYDDAHLPEGGDLQPRHLRAFLRRVRRAVTSRRRRPPGILGSELRFLCCGEYGEKGDRPHYHALLFGVSFNDGKPIGKDLFSSEALSQLWSVDGVPLGFASFGGVSGRSAAYVAQYSLKKQGARQWSEYYGEGIVKQPPFLRCSIRPGIGARWLEKYKQDTQHGYIVVDGQQFAVPRYYQKLLEVSDVGLSRMARARAADHAEETHKSAMELEAEEITAKRFLELTNPRKFKL